MIVVMTNGNAALEAAPGESSLGFAAPSMNLPKTMEGSFETAFPDVVKFIDKTYRTQANKKGRPLPDCLWAVTTPCTSPSNIRICSTM